MDMIVNDTTVTPTPTPTVTCAETPHAQTPAVNPASLLTPSFATTPKRGAARKLPKEPYTLYAYAMEQGGRVELTETVKQELEQRGLPARRISNAAYGIRKCFGKSVATERTGRTVTAYVVAV